MKSNYVTPKITLCYMKNDVIRTSSGAEIPTQPLSKEALSGFEKAWID